jgi:hypothetical protein
MAVLRRTGRSWSTETQNELAPGVTGTSTRALPSPLAFVTTAPGFVGPASGQPPGDWLIHTSYAVFGMPPVNDTATVSFPALSLTEP